MFSMDAEDLEQQAKDGDIRDYLNSSDAKRGESNPAYFLTQLHRLMSWLDKIGG